MTAERPAGKGSVKGPAAKKPAATQEALLQDIEQTRARLGASLEALVARTDVKARARRNASDMSALLRARMEQARGRAGERVTRVRSQVAGTVAGARHAVSSSGSQARHRAQGRIGAVRAAAWPAAAGTPGTQVPAVRARRAGWNVRARYAAERAVSVARERPLMTAATVATVTVALEFLVPALRRR